MVVGKNSSVMLQITNNIEKQKSEQKSSIGSIANAKSEEKNSANIRISDELLSQISKLGQGIKNGNDAIGVLQIADGVLQNISQDASRLSEISVSLNSAALNSDQKSMLKSEANKILESMSSSINSATYNGKSVFQGSLEFFSGNSGVELSLSAPTLEQVNISSSDSVNSFIKEISSTLGNIGSAIGKMGSINEGNINQMQNLKESNSKIEDSDIIEEYNKLNKAKLLENSALYVASFNTTSLQNKMSALLA